MGYVIITAILFACILIYFRIADQYNIIDKPNLRSSHTQVTLRGGGIIFPVAAIVADIWFHQPNLYFLAGIVIISVVSFIDDIKTLNNRTRFLFHIIAVALLFYGYSFFSFPWYWIVLAAILIIGTINAYNFMDGINGITGVYSLSIFGGIAWYNYQINPTISLQGFKQIAPQFVITMILACLVFLFFNFRRRAKCFAGDVGSVSLGFIVVALIIGIIIQEQNLKYIFFLAVYGTDSVLTIIHRLMLKQNIFEAHRLHYYQVLANERKIPHLWISVFYGLLQAIINLFILSTDYNFVITGLIACLPIALVYVGTKKRLMNVH